ncbi:hypothetical protein LCGC14_0601840 [marine sediment metagenome]|uniref:Uncharacterized protein n=1 Tax=marine sediment metagenome TaxID=412755 RepID=A0A0F9RUB5_9ZZZZ
MVQDILGQIQILRDHLQSAKESINLILDINSGGLLNTVSNLLDKCIKMVDCVQKVLKDRE